MKKEDKFASGEQAVMTAYRIMAGIALRRAIRNREAKGNEPEMHSRLPGDKRLKELQRRP